MSSEYCCCSSLRAARGGGGVPGRGKGETEEGWQDGRMDGRLGGSEEDSEVGRLGRMGTMGRMEVGMGGWADGRRCVRMGGWEDGWVGGMDVCNDAGCAVVCRSCSCRR